MGCCEGERKHGIRFAAPVAVFDDPHAVTIDDDSSQEDRFVTLGMDTLGRVLAVVFTFRGERIRVISARHATPAERSQYGRR